MGKLEGKVALITGATSGIGEACAKLFSDEGATVLIVGINEEQGINVEKEINSSKRIARSCFVKCDVTKEDDIKGLYDFVITNFGRLDILMNNAGVLFKKDLSEITEQEWKGVFDVNVNSIMYMTKQFIDLLVKSKGNILNTISIDGLQSYIKGRKNYAYSPSKAAALQFSQLCALNYTPLGIRVNCLCPGVVETPIFTNRDFSRFIPNIPIGRVAQPIEIARTALFIVSDDASYMSGSVIVVDGGSSLM